MVLATAYRLIYPDSEKRHFLYDPSWKWFVSKADNIFSQQILILICFLYIQIQEKIFYLLFWTKEAEHRLIEKPQQY